MKGSLLISGAFALGVAAGMLHLLPEVLHAGDHTIYALCALLFLMGICIGHDRTIFRTLRKSKPAILLIPLGTIAGTLSAMVLISPLFDNWSVSDLLAVGSGFGYYSLSSVFITEYRGAELGTIALMSNVIRELITLLAAPLLAAWFGKLAPIASGGATTMDTTLPVISRVSGNEFVFIAMFHGVVLDMCVPVLVSFFCQ